MQQSQYYKTVPVSERPKKDGYYQCLRARDKSWYELYFYKGQWYFYEEEAIEGYDHVDPQSYTHYLEQIPIPDAAVLRSALEKIANHDEEADTLFPSITVDMFKHIAREALSQTGDGWVRVEDWKENGNVLIAYEYGVAEAKRFNGKYYKDLATWIEFPGVTHVRRLPLPPQPQK